MSGNVLFVITAAAMLISATTAVTMWRRARSGPATSPGVLRVRGLARRLGHRGAFLLFLAILDAVYAWGLHLEATPQSAHIARPDVVLPITLWIWFWAATGLICLACAFLRSDRLAFAAAAAIKWGWGMTSLYLWLTRQQPNGWLSAVVWFSFAATVLIISAWPEPVPVLPVSEEPQ